jgi:hypothetical protein
MEIYAQAAGCRSKQQERGRMMDELFQSDYVGWGDQEFTLFKVYTKKLKDDKTGEVGTFDVSCQMPLIEFEGNRDPVGLLKYLARKYLVHCVRQTGVPYENWIVEFSPIMEKYKIPSHLFLDTGRDRAWLI